MVIYMPIQAVLFPKHFSILEIKRFLNEHNLKQIKPIHETVRFKRVRITEPSLYKSFSTKRLSNGVDLVLGYE
jgi:hypothetical protein